ncbi:mucin-13b isoform X2 [Thunnus thynnus]|uniref:mucin-13b isoform X2 n=1 Tax=Thunnus thynnus TaxID=8237 RepID=UPI003526E5EF
MAREFKLLFLLLFIVACANPGNTTTAQEPAAARTASPGNTTTTQEPAAARTASPGNTTTTQKPAATTTASPVIPATTQKPAATTTASPVIPATTQKPAATTTASPVIPATTQKPAATTTASPVIPATTQKPAATTTASPVIPATTQKPAATTTASPVIPATTQKPAATTTASPVIPATTQKPAATTTASPVIPATTQKPAATTTASPDITATTQKPTATTTASPDITATTQKPATTTGSGGVSTTTSVPATKPPGPCDSNPCGSGSTCEPRGPQDFVCLCLAGDYYNNKSKMCESAKVFPGQLTLDMTYNGNMTNKTSTEFQNASKEIIDALNAAYSESDGYTESTVLELRPSKNSRVWSRSEEKVNASVEIIFRTDSKINSSEVTKQIETASNCDKCVLGNAKFKETPLCDMKPCDEDTTECLSENGLYNCTCNDNYIKTPFSDRMCRVCPSGYKASGSECVACPFGYLGLNCNESWQLALVIVSSVLGGLLLITLILLPVVACKSSKKSSGKNKVGDPYVSHSSAKAPLANSSLAISRAPSVNNGPANGLGSFANAGAPRIPRATTTSSWDRRSDLEMTPSNSRQNLISAGKNMNVYEDADDMNSNPYVRPSSSLYAQTRPSSSLYAQDRPSSNLYAQDRPSSNLYAQDRPQSNPYAQARPQNNPYAQNRPQTNPYASSQGQTNPYYMHDDGRRFN